LSADSPLVSVIIPTRNSVNTITRTLDSLKRQTFSNVEIIVVDNRSNDGTQNAVMSAMPAARLLSAGPERSNQKNVGAQGARGEYLYFVDSDFVLEPGVIAEAVALCEDGGDAVVIHNTSDPTVGFWSRVRKLERDCYYFDPKHVAARFVKRRVFMGVGGFDTELLAGEDYDLHLRLILWGARIRWATNIEYHLGEPRGLTEISRKHIYYGKFLQRYIRKELPVRLQQLSPFRASYIRNWRKFMKDPRLLAGFIVYQYVRYLSAIAGMLSSSSVPVSAWVPAEEVTEAKRIASLASVSVVVVTRNRPEKLEKCIESLQTVLDKGAELVVVDDCSDASQPRLLPKTAKLIQNKRRLFLNESRNIGAAASSRAYVLYVDDDNLLHPGTAETLAETLESFRSIAVAAPLIVTPDNNVWYAGGWVSPVSAITVFSLRGRPRKLVPKRLMDTKLFHSCFMVRRKAFYEAGGFDSESFPMYLGEADLSEKLRKINYRVVVNPLGVVTHLIESRGMTGLLRNIHITEPARAYFVGRNRIVFMRYHAGWLRYFVFLVFFQPVIASIHVLTIIGSRGGNYKWTNLVGPYIRGMADGVLGEVRLGKKVLE